MTEDTEPKQTTPCPHCGESFVNLGAHLFQKHSTKEPTEVPVEEPVEDAALVAEVVKPKLKTIPGFSQGVRVNSAMRMMKLAAPICPNSKITMLRQPDGSYRPKDRGPQDQNCQLEGPQWWIACEARDHNPYYRTVVWYVEEDKYETDANGNDVMTGTKRIRHSTTFPNIVQVPIARRMHNGRGVIDSMRKKGRKRLGDLGYAEVCQFRNCQKPVDPKATSMAFGNYCSVEHLQLIAADAQAILLPQLTGPLEAGIEEQVAGKRARLLREAGAFS